MIKYIIPTLILLLLSGCGSSDNNVNDKNKAKVSTVIDMQKDVKYSVYHGDELRKTSSDAVVSIEKATQGEKTTTVVLLEGTAQIIRAE